MILRTSSQDSIVKQSNLEAYDRFGTSAGKKDEFWSRVEDFNYGIAYSLIEKQVGIKDKRVCELGSGTAAHLKWYKRDCREIIGLDISRQMLRLYLKTEGNSPNFGLITGDALTLPFKSGAFDVVTIYQSAHHFPNIYKCMDEMLRVAGAFAFLEPNKDSFLHRLVEYRRERRMVSKRFEVHSYKMVEYNSLGFSALQIKYFLKKRNVEVKIYYIFQLPMEISASVMRKSPFLFRILNLFGQVFTHVPLVKSQFGSLLVIAEKKEKELLLTRLQIHARDPKTKFPAKPILG